MENLVLSVCKSMILILLMALAGAAMEDEKAQGDDSRPERNFRVVSLHPNSILKEVNVRRYKDSTIVIFVQLNSKRFDLMKELDRQKLSPRCQDLDNINFMSNKSDRLDRRICEGIPQFLFEIISLFD